MSAYTDKLQEWVDTVRMCEDGGIPEVFRYLDVITSMPSLVGMKEHPERFTFPIAVVEGRPVFVGDELHCPNGLIYQVKEGDTKQFLNTLSWNPPKPKTVMVELLIGDAEHLAIPRGLWSIRVNEACRKALEEMK